jgi:hypothetical protein
MTTPNDLPTDLDLAPVVDRLDADTRKAAMKLTPREVRYLVDVYYQKQRDRIRASNQARAASEQAEPNRGVTWLMGQSEALERRVLTLLDVYGGSRPLGRWARSIVGIGPVIAAGLLAHIDIAKCPTAGHLWRFAGLDPSSNWIGRDAARKLVTSAVEKNDGEVSEATVQSVAEALNVSSESLTRFAKLYAEDDDFTASHLSKAAARCPWNARLKCLCWKIGQSFVKVSGNERDFYGKLYIRRKEYELRKNDNGDYAAQAAAKLERFKIGKSTEAYKHYSAGRLPPAHIQQRAERWAVKIFLSHYQHVDWLLATGSPPPVPYPQAIQGHAEYGYIAPPNMDEAK